MPNRAWRARIDTGAHELARRRARIDAEAVVPLPRFAVILMVGSPLEQRCPRLTKPRSAF
jgi:hypothetical protein